MAEDTEALNPKEDSEDPALWDMEHETAGKLIIYPIPTSFS